MYCLSTWIFVAASLLLALTLNHLAAGGTDRGPASRPATRPASRPAASGGQKAESRTVRVALCQTLCIDSDREGNFRRVSYAVEQAAKRGARLACFPETALLGWINPEAHQLADPIPGPTTERLAALAREHQLMIAIGLCEKEGERLYDSAVLIGADGRILHKHRKINTLVELLTPPYTRGTPDGIRAVQTPVGRVGLLICADTFKEELVTRMAGEKPELLIVPYGWAARPDEWPQHARSLHELVSSLARRVGCPVVGTDLVGVISAGPWRGRTYGGQSVAADASGRIVGTLRDRDVDLQIFDLPLGR